MANAARWYECGKPVHYQDEVSGQLWRGDWWRCRLYVGHPGACSPFPPKSDVVLVLNKNGHIVRE